LRMMIIHFPWKYKAYIDWFILWMISSL
jgi:hypothetical protein